jgi:CubicO group peptidase (beta-lactamase class C family)
MLKILAAFLLAAVTLSPATAQNIDSLIKAKTKTPFNGVIFISQPGKTYSKTKGFADWHKKTPLQLTDQFVIGSISKQITAVLVLQEMEKGHLKLAATVHTYLPEFKAAWADTVTIHQLLSHTSGYMQPDQPLVFRPGTRFAYSNMGYQLLAKIIEKTSGKSFVTLSTELFRKCNMKNSFHPATHAYKHLVKGYTVQQDGSLQEEEEDLAPHAASGTFISTAEDLARWNSLLHGGKLLADSTYQLMITKKEHAVRQHTVFGTLDYGYGITLGNKEQIGTTGIVPGFISMNFYFPADKMSVIVLENIAWSATDIKEMFYYHQQVLRLIHD